MGSVTRRGVLAGLQDFMEAPVLEMETAVSVGSSSRGRGKGQGKGGAKGKIPTGDEDGRFGWTNCPQLAVLSARRMCGLSFRQTKTRHREAEKDLQKIAALRSRRSIASEAVFA